MPKVRVNITVYRSTRFSGSSLILSCLTVSFSCGIVYSRVKRTPESEKKKTRISHQTENQKEMLVYVPGTYLSPFVLALEGGVNSNPSSRERLLLRTAYIPFCSSTRRRCCRTQEAGPERGVAAYRWTPEREQTIFYPNPL